ncbi:hypothetical protein HU200_005872 [Digitaria exilis]|uniref:F-box domain-containing protein n=1 Tax=Digitaria exilis TaxID=1010633 RepID=A0A835FPZ6_9POAL|nr:hypothetical protein HU200_005872 [Digitaria exilis]
MAAEASNYGTRWPAMGGASTSATRSVAPRHHREHGGENPFHFASQIERPAASPSAGTTKDSFDAARITTNYFTQSNSCPVGPTENRSRAGSPTSPIKMAPPPPPALMDDIIGEILLRLPPGDPACLVRASLVCKLWRSLLSDDGFHRRYRAFHQTPPVLGFFHNRKGTTVPNFVPVAQAPVVPYPAPGSGSDSEYRALDCRHGPVLLHCSAEPGLVVWDPITGEQQHVPQSMTNYDEPYIFMTAAVLCALDGCDHHQCRGGPYLIVLLGIDSNSVEHDGYDDEDDFAWASCGGLSSPGPILFNVEVVGRSLLAGDALYFTLEGGHRILRIGCVLSVIDALPVNAGNMALMGDELATKGEVPHVRLRPAIHSATPASTFQGSVDDPGGEDASRSGTDVTK